MAESNKKWYVLRAVSGKEAKVKEYIETDVKLRGLTDKVSWPTQKQLISSAVLVLIASIIISLFIWLVDTGFSKLMELVYSL